MELENYGFYGSVPAPDGRSLRLGAITEVLRLPGATDTVDVREGVFRLDTIRIGTERPWIVTRQGPDATGHMVSDSIWLDRYTMRTLATWRSDALGESRLRFDRRAVSAEITDLRGRTRRNRVLHEAEAYGLLGIDLILGSLPYRQGMTGALPVVDNRNQRMQWIRFTALTQQPEPRMVGGAVMFKPVWIVRVELGREQWRYWVDPESRSVLRREYTDDNGQRLLMVRGNVAPAVQVFPVERLPVPMARPRGRQP
jgi:hypothetical protein